MNKYDLEKVIELHARWLSNDPTGVKANLRGADLRCANLRGANLRGADLYDADLRYADLRGANLSEADLRYADLRGANLSDADLRYAELSGVNLRDAELSGVNLRGSTGILRAECAWTDHGECGRNLLCVKVGDAPRYFCGCFSGTEEELRKYIADGDEALRASRTLALDFCAARMAEMIEKRK